MVSCGVYEIRCTVTGMVYVGSSCQIRTRWMQHRMWLQRGRHHSRKLQNAWNKYGAHAFTFTVIEAVADPAELLTREQWHMDNLHAYSRECGYNSRPLAASNRGRNLSEEHKAKIAAAHMGKTMSAESIAKRLATIRANRPGPTQREQRAMRAEQRRGHTRTARLITEEERIKRSAANRKRFDDPEYRAKILAANRKRFDDPEYRAKISAAHLGRTHTEEARERIAASKRGKKMSPEAVAKSVSTRMARHRPTPPQPCVVCERLYKPLRKGRCVTCDHYLRSHGTDESPEQRARTTALLRGRPKSAAHREKLAEAHRGKKLTPEHIAKVAAANRGRKATAEHRAKISAALRGKTKSPEHVAKSVASRAKRKHHSPAQQFFTFED